MKYLYLFYTLAVAIMSGGFVPCAMAEETITASPDAESETVDAKDSKILSCIKNMKLISGKVNTNADIFVLIVFTDFHVDNLCGGREDLKEVAKAFKKGGVAKILQQLQKKKNVQTILAVQEGTNLKHVKKHIVKWLGLKCPIMQYKPDDEAFTGVVGDGDLVVAYSENDEYIAEGAIDMVGHTMDRFLKELNKWIAAHKN
ncbi:MAG: hypothetical protein IKZ13_04900 [Akkermansia sp.]|nr:hypothetical protein [Bacteroidaceae bacterium]MBR5894860.1 hypothetical protein [Akkermansia sp.]